MRILAFPGRLNTKAKAPVRDWSTQEIADFYRAHRLLADNGAGIGIDRGVSDEGEPWMVFFDTASHDVFLHIARIDNVCHLVCEPFNMRLDAADITSLIAQFEHAVRDYLAIRSERAKNVVIHPAARIIMSISAVFLLFKLENGEAYAKGLADKGALGAETRTSEKSAGALARAQSAFQRAFDAAEAPVAAALLAGIILAGELALSPQRGAAPEAELEKLVALALAEHEPVLVRAEGASIEAVVAETIQHAPPPVTVELPLAALEIPVPELAEMPQSIQFTPPDTVVQLAALGPAADFRLAQVTPVAVAAPGGEKGLEGRVVAADEPSDAARGLELLFGLSKGKIRPSDPAPAEAAPAVAKLGDVTLANLEEIDGQLAYSARIDLAVSDIFPLFRYLGQHMPGFEIGFDKGTNLIEQDGLSGLDVTAVARVTTMFGDGSSYTIIGRADLLDGVLTLFA